MRMRVPRALPALLLLLLAAFAGAGAMRCEQWAVAPGSTHAYRARLLNAAGAAVGESGPAVAYVHMVPPAPTGVRASLTDVRYVTVRWAPRPPGSPHAVDGYEVLVDGAPATATPLPAARTRFSFAYPPRRPPASVSVRAVNALGRGPASAPVRVDGLPGPPPGVSRSPSPTPSVTPSPTPTPLPSPTPSVTPTSSASPIATPSPTPTPLPSPSATPSPTPTPTAAPSATPSPTSSATPPPTPSPSVTPSPPPMPSATPSATPSPPPMPSATPIATPSPTPTPLLSPSATPSPTPLPSPSATPTPTPSPSVTPTTSPSSAPSPTPSAPLPGAPTNLAIASNTYAEHSFSWGAPAGAASYVVYAGGSRIARALTEPFYNLSSPAPNTAFVYSVAAIAASPGGGEGANATITVWSPPAAPAGVATGAVTTTSIEVTWNASAGATAYRVYRAGLATQLASVASSPATITGLSFGTAYSFEVAACSPLSGVEGARSAATAPRYTLTGNPPMPSLSSPNATAINGTWAATPDAFGYNVYRGGALVARVTSPSFAEAGLTPATSYSYAVSALNGDGAESARSATVSLATRPGAPASASATVLSPTSVRVDWAAPIPSTAVASYTVYRTPGAIAYGPFAAGTLSADAAGLSPEVTYAFEVRATTSGGEGAGASASATPTVLPWPPTAVSASIVGDTSLNVSWSGASTVGTPIAGYYVYRNGVKVSAPIQPASTYYTDTGLSAGSAYTYTVSAFNDFGESAPSTASATATTIDVFATPPTSVTATAINATAVSVVWSAASSAGTAVQGYYVYRNGTRVSPLVAGTAYADAGLVGDTAYTYTVSAINGRGESSPSSASSTATTPKPTAWIFDYTGSDQTWIAPVGVTSVWVKLWGAGGGTGSVSDRSGGAGGFASGLMSVTPGQAYTVIVGQGGRPSTVSTAATYGGGGAVASASLSGSTGGGRSAIRLSGGADDIITAGGGGGAGIPSSSSTVSGDGGVGGGLVGGRHPYYGSSVSFAAFGGTQTEGGRGQTDGLVGAKYSGAMKPYVVEISGGGGGGGYYGGGSGSYGAGGGSSYYGDARITNGATVVGGNGASGPAAANAGDWDYVAPVAVGGTANMRSGGNGRVVILLYANATQVSNISVAVADVDSIADSYGGRVSWTAPPSVAGDTFTVWANGVVVGTTNATSLEIRGLSTSSLVTVASSRTIPASAAYTVVNPLPLDAPALSTAIPWFNLRACYATRRMRIGYVGPTIQLARSDGTAQDFYADERGDLNTAFNRTGTSYATWSAGMNVSVATWYDQSGGGFHVKQASSASRPTYTGGRVGFGNAVSLSVEATLGVLATGQKAYTIHYRGANRDPYLAFYRTPVSLGYAGGVFGYYPKVSSSATVAVDGDGYPWFFTDGRTNYTGNFRLANSSPFQMLPNSRYAVTTAVNAASKTGTLTMNLSPTGGGGNRTASLDVSNLGFFAYSSAYARLNLGRTIYSGDWDGRWTGELDEVMIIDRTLSLAEMQTLHGLTVVPEPVPSAPTAVAALASGATAVSVSWGGAASAGDVIQGYYVYRNGTKVSPLVAGTSYTDAGLVTGTPYVYTVSAKNSAGESAPSTASATATTIDVFATPPTSVTATAINATAVSVVWSAASSAGTAVQGYYVYRNGTRVSPLVAGTAYTDAGLDGAMPYAYTVSVLNGRGESSPSSASSTATTLTPSAWIFDYTGSDQTWIAPVGATSVWVKLWGAGGGTGSDSDRRGGAGGFASGLMSVTPGQAYTVIVGQGGRPSTVSTAATYGGGGAVASASLSSSTGGGRSAIRLSGGADDIITAGGGGGAGIPSFSSSYSGDGGVGGGLVGGRHPYYGSSLSFAAFGGTQTEGGRGETDGLVGAKYSGAMKPNVIVFSGGGGGGGYYGGGSGSYGAGGGSSYYGDARITNGATVVGGNGASGPAAANAGDRDYVAPVAVGGTASMRSGGNGRVVILMFANATQVSNISVAVGSTVADSTAGSYAGLVSWTAPPSVAGDTFTVWANGVAVGSTNATLLEIRGLSSSSLVTVASSRTIPASAAYTVVNPLPLDALLTSTAVQWYNIRACYATRRMRIGYVGPTIQLVRSDGTAQDFYADERGDLNTAFNRTGTSYATWSAGMNVSVATWYDQSGGGFHAKQATSASRPTYTGVRVGFGNAASLSVAASRGVLASGQKAYTIHYRGSNKAPYLAFYRTPVSLGYAGGVFGYDPKVSSSASVAVDGDGYPWFFTDGRTNYTGNFRLADSSSFQMLPNSRYAVTTAVNAASTTGTLALNLSPTGGGGNRTASLDVSNLGFFAYSSAYASLSLGRTIYSGDWDGRWTGELDEVLVVDKTLSLAEMQTLHGLTAVPEPVPSPPTTVAALASGATAVSVSWGGAASAGDAIQGYYVYRNGTKVSPLVAGTSHTDAGLVAGTPYVYTVSAKNSAGESAPSAALATATPGA